MLAARDLLFCPDRVILDNKRHRTRAIMVGADLAGVSCLRRALGAARVRLDERPAAVPSLDEMARAAGVSARTLQRHFARELNTTSHAIVLRWRLEAARRTLVEHEVSSVLEAALRHGFDHPGRFATAYRRAFGEAPSRTLRSAQSSVPIMVQATAPLIELAPFVPCDHREAGRACRATDDLAIALTHARDLTLADGRPGISPDPQRLRVEGHLDERSIVLSLRHPARATVLWMDRFPLVSRKGLAWADRAVGAIQMAIAAEQVEQARRTPRHRASADTLYIRAKPAALALEPATVHTALDLLNEALHRDPSHARAHALTGWSQAQGANHHFLRDEAAEQRCAIEHGRRALALAPDDPEVLTFVAGVLSLTGQLDEAERLVSQSLALDPNQPEAWRRRGFIQNFRGNHELASRAFQQALAAWPAGNDANLAMVGLGIARFSAGDYPRSARLLGRAVELRPSRGWPYRFFTAAAVHAGSVETSRRSLLSLQRAFPDLTVTRCASDALHQDALGRVLDGLAQAGLPG